ncbi:MinD/ParA family protein [Methanothermococcus sp. SCGC AD-155-C09]|nr:MinD/ParA family protein [Methanothermococcus sp. SCGC AD-155-C09]
MKIGFYNIQGGTGKTTIAANMAYHISESINTIYVDCDIYGGNSALLFNLEENPYTLNAYLDGKCSVEDIIHEYDNLSVVVCDTTPNAFDTDFNMERFLYFDKYVSKKYDVAIFDLPPNITEGNILFSGDIRFYKMIVVAEDSIPGIAGALKTIELLNALNIGVMCTIVNKDRGIVDFEDILEEDIEILPYDESIESQWSEGEPIIKKKSNFGKELTYLTDELLETYLERDLATERALEIAKEFKESVLGSEDEE